MEKGIKKISYKVLPFVLCICIVSGAYAPAYATSNTGQYDFNIYQNTNTLVTYSSSTNSFVSNIYTLLSNFKINFDSFAASWNTSSFLPNSLLNSINSSITTLNNNYVNNSANLSKLTDIYNTLVAINADTYTIDSNVDNIYTWVMAIGQALASIQTDISGIKTDTANLSGIKTDTANLSGIKTDTANLSGIKTDIETFNVDFNDISWTQSNITVSGYYKSLDSAAISSQTNSNEWFIRLSSVNWSNAIYKITIPLFMGGLINNPMNIELGFVNNGVFQKYDDVIYSYDQVSQSTDIYFTIDSKFYNPSSSYYLHITSDFNQMFINPNNSVLSYGILPSNIDYYSVADNMIFKNILKLFKQAKEVFFDDKTIAAKKANQAQEDSVLSNFTGSGAASASVSDFGAVKDSIVDFKSGFSGGASSSDTFSFMDGDSNAWDWFTQDTANDLDRTQGTNNSILRSSSSVAYDTPLLDSYYNSILSILGGE